MLAPDLAGYLSATATLISAGVGLWGKHYIKDFKNFKRHLLAIGLYVEQLRKILRQHNIPIPQPTEEVQEILNLAKDEIDADEYHY